MADAQLRAVITAEDRASKVIADVGGSLNKVQDSLERAQGASQAFALGLAGVAAAGVAAGVKAISAAQESVLVTKQLEAVLKSTGGASGLFKEDILDQAAALQKLTNFSDEAVVSSANLLLTFTNIQGPIMQRAIDTTLDMSAALGQDLKSSAIQLGKALNDPTEGINALRRVGVSFNEDQRKVIESLVETGQTAKAQQVILDELAKEFGGSAQAQAEPIAQLKNAIGEAWEKIGFELLPMVNKFAQAIQNLVNDHIVSWIESTKKVISFLAEHKSVLIIVAGAIVGGLVPAIYAAALAFGALAISLAPFLIGGAIIGGLIAGIWWIIKHWEDIESKAVEIWGSITSYLSQQWASITAAISSAWTSIQNFFGVVWGGISAVFNYWISFITGLVIAAFNAMGIDIIGCLQIISENIALAWSAIKTAFTASLVFITSTWNTVWSAIRDFVVPIWDAIKSVINVGLEWIKTKFATAMAPIKSNWDSLWNGFKGVVGSAWDYITGKITEGVNAAIRQINRLISGINSIANSGAKAIGISVPNIPSIKSVNDAVISPRGDIISTHPDDYLIATKNPGSLFGAGGAGRGIVVNVYGDVSGQDLIDKVARGIMNQLKQNAQV